MIVLTNLNLNKNELQNAVIQNLATAPSSPVKGQVYYDSGNNLWYGYNGTAWVSITAPTADQVIALINASTASIDLEKMPTDVQTAVTNMHTHSNKTVLDNTTASFTTADETKLDSIEAGADITDAVNIATSINGVVGKVTPIDADVLPILDSASSNSLKKLSWANLKATLKTYNDTLYNTYNHPTGDGNLHVPANGTTNNGKILTAGASAGTYTWATNTPDWANITNKPTNTVANIDDAVTKRHTQNTDTTLTGSGANVVNTTGAGNVVDFKVNNTTKSSIDTNGKFTGVSAKATILETGRTISASGDATGTSPSFDGSGNATIPLTLASVGTAGTYTKVTTDAKGRVTAGASLSATDIPTLTHDKISDFDTGVRANTLNQMAVPTASVSMNNQKITNLATPTTGTDAVNKDYVDSARSGISLKDPVRVASTANVNITTGGLLTIDGVTLIAGNRVLLKNQTAQAENGIYSAGTGGWARVIDANSASNIQAGLAVWVNEGTTNGDSRWVLTTNDDIVVGTTALIFTKDFQASDIVAGAGLTKSGNQLDAVGTANRITVNADSIDIASTYAGQSSINTVGTITAGTWNGNDIPIANGGTGASDAVTARANLGTLGKYGVTIGDGTATQFVINHNLNSYDAFVMIREVASPYNVVMTDVQIIDANNVRILFAVAPTTGAYRVVVTG